MDNSFPKSARILDNWEFRKIGKMGCRYATPHFVLICSPALTADSRLGITVSKKVGNAVVRNRIKRRIREFFRNRKINIKKSDYIIIVRPSAKHLSSTLFNNELRKLFCRV